MPIVNVEIVLGANETFRPEIVSELAEELGDIFQSPRGGTWIKVYALPAEHYGENGGMPDRVYPIFITITKAELPVPEELGDEVRKITGAVAQICSRPSQNVHVIYQPSAKGRVAFGGKLVR